MSISISNAQALFDRLIVVDWSANAAPKLGRDSIWIAVFDAVSPANASNVATRSAGLDSIHAAIVGAPHRRRTLLAVDFSLGYPSGTARALGLGGVPWESMWRLLCELVVDDERNANNRFAVAGELNRRMMELDPGRRAGPFWGCPRTRPTPNLTSTKVAASPLGEWRHVEALLRSTGSRPFSSWQLLGAGAVGGQSLLGIAALERLRRRLDPEIEWDVWPFTTGFALPHATAVNDAVVVAEIWPSMIEWERPALGATRVRDEAQVIALGNLLWEANLDGRLADLFVPEIVGDAVASAPANVAEVVVAEEGWVLGAGAWPASR